MFVVFRALAALLALVSYPSVAMNFQQKSVPLGHPANGNLVHLTGSAWLAVSGHNTEKRWLSLVDVNQGRATAVPLLPTLQFFQQAKLAGFAHHQLVGLATDGLYRFDMTSQQWLPLLKGSSMYRVVDAKRLLSLNFSYDINQDGLSDFLVPDFNAWHLYIQQADGSFLQDDLALDSEMMVFNDRSNYQAKVPQIVDLNNDGRRDIAFAVNDTLTVFAQNSRGRFDTISTLPLGVGLTPDAQAQQRPGDGRSFENLVLSRLERLADINGDGLTDLVVQQQHYIDAMDQKYNYLIHYGTLQNGWMRFTPTPDQQIKTAGIQFDVTFADLDNDNRVDFYTPVAQIGIGAIVRALVSGSADIEMQFYKQQPDGSFGTKPTYRQEITVEIKITSGQVNMPVAAVLSGQDGKASLLLADDEETLRVYGPVGAKLFSEKNIKKNIALPLRGMESLTADVNNDGKQDLVMPYTSQESKASLTNQVQILLQQ